MKSITFNIHRGNSFISKLIMRSSHGRFSHVSVEFDGCIYESIEGKGFIKSNKLSWKHSPIKERYVVMVSNKRYKQFEDWSEEQVGKRYDYTGVLSHASPFFFKPRQGYWYCSEYTFVLLNKIVGILGDDSQHHKVSPQLFRDILRLAKGVKRLL